MDPKIRIVQFKRHADGSCEAMVCYDRSVTVTLTKGLAARPEGLTQEEHERSFFGGLKAEITKEVAAGDADTSDIEGRTLAELLARP